MVGSGNVVVFCTYDAWGNILDTSGNEVVASTYNAWGNILTTTGTLADTLGKYNPPATAAMSTTRKPASITCKADIITPKSVDL